MLPITDYDFDLPDQLVARRPAQRGTDRLLVLRSDGSSEHSRFAHLPSLLRQGDLLVANNTRVLPAQLLGHRVGVEGGGVEGGGVEGGGVEGVAGGGGRVQALLVEKVDDTTWSTLCKPARRLRPGQRVRFVDHATPDEGVEATVLERRNEQTVLRFDRELEPLLSTIGQMPIPPYLGRAPDQQDREDYQTVFAAEPGAVAAPTAGLHFTAGLLQELERNGIGHTTLTLHVGPGTFRPVQTEDAAEHRLEPERFVVSAATAAAVGRVRQRGGRVVAVGTTVARTLESICDQHGAIEARTGATDLYIKPGHRFRAVDLLLTNFHLPRSTLLLLVAAFAGRERILGVYRDAIARGYRFYSYGDAMLLEPPRRE